MERRELQLKWSKRDSAHSAIVSHTLLSSHGCKRERERERKKKRQLGWAWKWIQTSSFLPSSCPGERNSFCITLLLFFFYLLFLFSKHGRRRRRRCLQQKLSPQTSPPLPSSSPRQMKRRGGVQKRVPSLTMPHDLDLHLSLFPKSAHLFFVLVQTGGGSDEMGLTRHTCIPSKCTHVQYSRPRVFSLTRSNIPFYLVVLNVSYMREKKCKVIMKYN